MNERQRLTSISVIKRFPATNPPWLPSVFDKVPTRRVSHGKSPKWGPRTECASSMTRRASCWLHACASSLTGATIAVHGKHGVGDHDRPPGRRGEQLRHGVQRRSGGKPRPAAPRFFASLQPSIIEAWFSSSEQMRT